MLYNIEKKSVRTQKQCLTCQHFDKRTKKCSGVGKTCFPYDHKTQTIIDTITKLPLKIKEED